MSIELCEPPLPHAASLQLVGHMARQLQWASEHLAAVLGAVDEAGEGGAGFWGVV